MVPFDYITQLHKLVTARRRPLCYGALQGAKVVGVSPVRSTGCIVGQGLSFPSVFTSSRFIWETVRVVRKAGFII